MKSTIKAGILLFAGAMLFVSCSKDRNTNPAVAKTTSADPVDSIIGTYTGSMHSIHQIVYYQNYTDQYYQDTSYPMTIVIYKVASDSFRVSDSLFFYFSFTSGINTYHIAYDTTGIYGSETPSDIGIGEDSLHFIPAADSLYFNTRHNHPGGAVTEFKSQFFSGKKI